MALRATTTLTSSSPALPTPSRTAWDFDHTSASWDTDVTAASWSAVQTAVSNAANDPGTVSVPKYHRVEYTGSDIGSSVSLSFADPGNAAGEVYILVEPTTEYTKIQGEIQLSNGGLRDIKFAGWQVEPDVTTHGGSAGCFDAAGANTRLSIYNCRGGGHWRSLSRSDFTDFLVPSAGNNSITVDSCDIRRIKQVAKMEGGVMHFKNNFMTDVVDDGVFLTVQGQSPNYAYLYIVQNVLCDMWDDAADSGLHPDFVQTGHANDLSTDSYEIESAQNVVLMSNAVQHSGHGLYIQRGGGSAAIQSSLESTDDFMLVTGRRGIANCDWNTTITRAFIARPPTDVPVNNQATTEFVPSIENENPAMNGTGVFTISNTLAAALQDTNGRGFGGYTLDITANSNTATGNDDAYDNRFPNASFTWDTSTDSNQWHLDTPNSTDMPRTRAGVRNYVSATYTPNSGAIGSPSTGWAVNGFTDPATIG